MRAGEQVADRFEIEEVAGAGAMATVYRARDLATGDIVALKVVRQLGEKYLARFAREAIILSSIRHPNVVRYLDHGKTARGEMYMAMEWLDGEDLATHLASATLSVRSATALARQAALGLAAAHERGIIHRDIKPSNLFLVDGSVERLKVLDFGVARVAAASALTQTGARIGTLRYMAPEQARGERDLDARADIWALGCVYYECLTGRPAFPGSSEMAVIAKLILEQPPRARSLNTEVPREIDDLVSSMLEKDPGDRISSAEQVAAELEAVDLGRTANDTTGERVATALTDAENRLLCVVIAGPERAEPGATIALGRFPLRKRRLLRPTVQTYGGRMEELAGGALIVTLAGAGSATELAARAARCALAVAQVAPRSPVALAIGRGQIAGRSPVGEVIDRADSVLREAAEPAVIHLDDTSARLLDTQFEVRRVNGRHQLIRERAELDTSRTLLGRHTRFVGRRRELATLEALFAESFDESVARAAVVIGAAGMGKSRLRFELLRRLRERYDNLQVWLARGDPMRAGSPFGMLAEALSRTVGIHAGAPIDENRARLEAEVSRHLATAERTRVSVFLAELAGVPFTSSSNVELGAAQKDLRLMGDQIRRAWEDWLAAETEVAPVLICFEDLHWGDRPTVELIDRALRNLVDRPLAVLALARPAVRDLFGAPWEARDAQEIRLVPLTRKASEQLVVDALGGENPGELAGLIAAKAEGNPFYIEELIRVAASRRDSGGLGRPEAAMGMPDTILAMASARLEQLEPDARQILRAASIFGRSFWADAVATLVGPSFAVEVVDEWLQILEDRELVTRRREPRFPGHSELSFRHDLIREAAYTMLTAEDRALGHRLAAEWLTAVGERDELTLAEHFERGDRPGDAIGWYRRAAELAVEGSDLEQALVRVGRAIECGATGDELIALRLIEIEAYLWRGENSEVARCAGALLPELAVGSDLWCVNACNLGLASIRLGDIDTLVEIGQQLLGTLEQSEPSAEQVIAAARVGASLLYRRHPLADELYARVDDLAPGFDHDRRVAGRTQFAEAQRAYLAGDLGRALEAFMRAVDCYREAGNLRLVAQHSGNVAATLLALGGYADAEAVMRESISVFERLGLAGAAWGTRLNLAIALAHLDRSDEASHLAADAAAGFEGQGNKRMAGAAHAWLARLHLSAGDRQGAERAAMLACELLASTPPMRAFALAVLAAAQRDGDDQAAALASAEEAAAIIAEFGHIEEGEIYVRLVHARLLDDSGARERARVAMAASVARLEDRAARISSPALRSQFLEAVPENAETIELGRSWAVSRDL